MTLLCPARGVIVPSWSHS